MNELSTTTRQLPEKIGDLARFVLLHEEAVQAQKAQIRAIKKMSLAKDVYEQKLHEAQEIGQIAVEAAQKMGELLLQIQKHQGQRTDITSSESRTKSEQLEEIGITRQRSNEYEQMAQNPEAVKTAIEKAIERGDVVSRSQVMKEISKAKQEQAELYNRKIQKMQEQLDSRPIIKTIPQDYEKLKAQLDRAEREAERLSSDYQKARQKISDQNKTVEALKAQLGADRVIRDADMDIQHFTIATHDYIRRYGGHIWTFEQIQNVNEGTRADFINAIKTLDGFAQQLIRNLEGNVNE